MSTEKNPVAHTGNEILEIIFSYAAKLNKERDIDELLILLSTMAKELVEAERCTVWLWDKQSGELYSRLADGTGSLRIPDCSGLVGYAIQNNAEIICNDPYDDPRFNKEVDKKTGYLTRCILIVPMYGENGEIIGAFQVLNKVTGSLLFDARDLERLQLTASFSGKALEASLLHDEIEKTQQEIINILGEVGESRSRETGNHVKRVAAYCKIIAEEMGLPKEDVDLLVLVSPLHDLGKVSIPDAILQKPGKLTDEEYNEMKTHSTVGFEVLRQSNRRMLNVAAEIAHQHHERHDGRGYPQGLSGEQIHPFARIASLADVFDALISDRVYKKAWEPERVIALIKEERGRQFNPDVVDAFLNKLDLIMEMKEKYKDIFAGE